MKPLLIFIDDHMIEWDVLLYIYKYILSDISQEKRALRQLKTKDKKKINENKNNNSALIEEEKAIKDIRNKQRRDRRMVESQDGVIEDNIHCE